jgi:hypothetical protein
MLGRKHAPVHSCASLSPLLRRMAHRRRRINGASPSRPTRNLGLNSTFGAPRLGIAHHIG